MNVKVPAQELHTEYVQQLLNSLRAEDMQPTLARWNVAAGSHRGIAGYWVQGAEMNNLSPFVQHCSLAKHKVLTRMNVEALESLYSSILAFHDEEDEAPERQMTYGE